MLSFLYDFHYESDVDIVISHFNFNSKHHDKCKFTLTFIPLVTIFNLFPVEVIQNANIANFVYYGKTWIYKSKFVALTFTVRCESGPTSDVRPQGAIALPLVRAAQSVAVVTQKHRLLPVHVRVLSVQTMRDYLAYCPLKCHR